MVKSYVQNVVSETCNYTPCILQGALQGVGCHYKGCNTFQKRVTPLVMQMKRVTPLVMPPREKSMSRRQAVGLGATGVQQ